MMGKPLVITLGQLLSLAVLVLVARLVVWLWRRQQKQKMSPAFPQALPDAGERPQDGQLMAEIERLRAQVSRLGQEVEALKASRASTSQQANYTQAIEMARQGQPVVEVANRCGISRAEAELIVAMHGGKDNT
jgi:hypothetical protein